MLKCQQSTSTAVHSAVDLLLLIFIPLFCGGCVFTCFVVQYLMLFLVFNHLAGTERASWLLYLNCLLMSCNCWCSVSPSNSTEGRSALCDTHFSILASMLHTCSCFS